MSNKVRAILLKKIKDETILLESLSNLKIIYTKTSTEIQLNEICKLIKKDGYFVAEITENYYMPDLHAQILESNKLIQSIILKYDQILNEKINEMQRKKIEENIIDNIKKQETKRKNDNAIVNCLDLKIYDELSKKPWNSKFRKVYQK